MAQCKGCGLKKLEWLKEGNKWVLYDELGRIHNCGQYKPETKQQARSACKHGVLLDRWCQLCEEERN